MYNPDPPSLHSLFKWLVQKYKYKVDMVSYDQWLSDLKKACKTKENALFPLIPIFPRNSNAVPTVKDYPTFDCKQTFGVLEHFELAPPTSWYAINDKVLTHVFDSLRQIDADFPVPRNSDSLMFEFD
jgi:hypothetical protein